MMYLGDYVEDETVHFLWGTNAGDGASITRAADGTVSVYKDNGVAQSVAGVTDTEDFDSLTGIHACTIDLSADAFYAVGADYAVVLSAATIDGETVNAVLAHFSIENRFDEVDVVEALGTAVEATSGQFHVLDDAGNTVANESKQDTIDTVVDAINTIVSALPNGGSLSSLALEASVQTMDAICDAIKVVTDKFAFTTANQVDSNPLSIEGQALGAKAGDNFNVFFHNAGGDTAQTVDDVGSGGGGDATEAKQDTIIANLATVDGVVDTILVDTAELQTDWVDGGRLDLILDAILLDTGTTLDAAISTIDGIVDAILVDTGTTLDGLITTVDTVVDAIKVQTDKTVFTVANQLDVNVLGIESADPSDTINAAADAAIETYHLDHIFAVTYDPASKPGAADALLNELVENDGGVSRYTANALEEGPSGAATDQLLSTTIATVNSQTDFDLTAGSGDDDAYNDMMAIFYDADGDPSVRTVTNYTAAGFNIVIDSAPDFTVVGTDAIKILAVPPGSSAPTAAQVADAVWDELVTGHDGAGKAGAQLWTDLDAVLADTDELQTDLADGGRLDLLIDAILLDTGTTLDGLITTVDTVVDAIKVVTDKFVFTVANEVDANALSLEGQALSAKVGDNFELFFQNGGADTTKIVDNVGAGTMMGAGATQQTILVRDDTGDPIADADIWLTNDALGNNTVAGTLQTDSNGEVDFMVDLGSTYYVWVQKDGKLSIQGQAWTPS